jgi:hypothetical protein
MEIKMKSTSVATMLTALLFAASQAALAQEPIPLEQEAATYADCCCAAGCGSSWYASLEATIFKFHESGGIRNADASESDDMGYEVFPRIEIGRIDCDGWGTRARFWMFEDSVNLPNDGLIDIETYNIDLEVFQTLDINECTAVELAVGLRYNSFEMFEEGEDGNVDFDGFGLTFGVEARRATCGGNMYAKARFSILTGDIEYDDVDAVTDGTYDNHISDQLELGVGYQWCRCMFTGSTVNLRVGYELQRWSEYGVADTNDDDYLLDVGFAGFVAGGTIEF